MKSPRLPAIALVASAFAVSVPRAVNVTAQTQAPTTVDAAFQKFWDAKSPSDASKLVDTVLKTGVTYDDALKRLKRGRSYSPEVKRGAFRLQRRTSLGYCPRSPGT